MLETDEVDIDYFTPASSTSLARIFSSSQVDGGQEPSLKYVSPLPTQIADKQEGTKPTQCIYASAFHVYEWFNNTHVPKGKLGFAVMQMTQTNIHNMVIYNSEKTTLSCVTLNPNIILNIDREHRISYYDSSKRYWSVYTTQPELKKIVDIMEQLNVQLKYSMQSVDDTPKHIGVEKLEEAMVKKINEDRESDTDSSLNNKRTKEIILKRMATMGQSVLPPSHITVLTSDSSDTNEGSNLPKIRHKPFKINTKKHAEKKANQDEINSDTSNKILPMKPTIRESDLSMINVVDQQIVPITCDIQKSTNIVNEDTFMNIYISEQRVTNSELRMNMNKMSDKMDVILDKVKDIKTIHPNQPTSSSSLFQNEIVSKLLGEYERKIKMYEEFLKFKGFDNCTLEILPQSSKQLSMKVPQESNLDIICKQKDDEISQLRDEVQRLSSKCEENVPIKNDTDIVIEKEISNLRQELEIKNAEIKSLSKNLDSITNETERDDFKNKLKEVMNDTFQTISRTFDNNETYSGTNIKNVVASVIKQTTMNALLNE